MTKNLFIVMFGLISAPIIEHIEKYLYNDWDFIKFLIPLIIMDTIFGVLKNWKYGTLSSDAWGKVVWKFISYTSLLILAHILTHFTVDGNVVVVFTWLDEAVYSALMVKEGISIVENLGAISPTLLPKWLLIRLKQFDETGKFLNTETPVNENPQV